MIMRAGCHVPLAQRKTELASFAIQPAMGGVMICISKCMSLRASSSVWAGQHQSAARKDVWFERRRPGGRDRGQSPSSLCFVHPTRSSWLARCGSMLVSRPTAIPLGLASPPCGPEERFSAGVSVSRADVATCYPDQWPEPTSAHHGDVRNRQRVGKRARPGHLPGSVPPIPHRTAPQVRA